MNKIETKIYKNINKIFLNDWQILWNDSDCGHFFNSPKWFQICLETFKPKQYFIFATYQNGELKAVLPLTKSKKFGITVLCSLGGKHLEKSSIFIADDNAQILSSMISKIEKKGNLFLSEVGEELAVGIEKIKPNVLNSTISINPYIGLYADPRRYLSKKQARQFNNLFNKYDSRLKHGHYKKNLKRYLNTVFNVELKSTKKLKGKDIFSDEIARKLYKNIIKIAPEHVIVDVLYFGNTPVVTMFGLNYKNKYLAFHTSYRLDYRKLNPGKILLYKMINKLHKEKFNFFDFSRGGHMLKREFTPNFKLQYDVYHSTKVFVRYWWGFINMLRRIKAWLGKNDYSLDGEYLFKRLKTVQYLDAEIIHRLK